MSKGVRWIEHQGKKILLNDYAGLKGSEYLAAIEATRQELSKLPEGAYHRTLTIFTGTAVSAETVAKGQEIGDLVQKKGLVGPAAIVDVSEVVASMAKAIRPDIYVAKTVEEAKDWLASQPE